MSTISLQLPNAGTAVDISAIGPEKSFNVTGGFEGLAVLEISQDGSNFDKIAQVEKNQDPVTLSYVAAFARVTFVGGSSGAEAFISGPIENASLITSNIIVPQQDGPGASVDISNYGEVKTLIIDGSLIAQQIVIEISNDGSFSPIAQWSSTDEGPITLRGFWKSIRARVNGYRSGGATLQIAGFDNSSNPSPANWSLNVVRYYFIDNENGDDGNVGYIDAAAGTIFTAAQTGPVALKTREELSNRLPREGARRALVVLFKPRSDDGNYLNKAGASDFFDQQYSGYNILIMRGSDLTNSINDRIDLGGIADAAAVGPGAGGVWTASGAMAGFTVTVAAGVLPTQDQLAGLKLQFDGNVTSGARTLGSIGLVRLSDTTFDIARNMTLANGDTFQFMRPGVKFTTVVGVLGWNGPFPTAASTSIYRGTVVAGMEFTASTTVWTTAGPLIPVFIRISGAGSTLLQFSGALATSSVYADETQTSRTILNVFDIRSALGLGTGGGAPSSAASAGSVFQFAAVHAAAQFSRSEGSPMSIGDACIFLGELRAAGFQSTPPSADGQAFAGVTIGTPGTTTTNRPCKINAGCRIFGSRLGINRVDVAGSTAAGGVTSVFALLGIDSAYQIGNVTGAAAAGVGLFDLTDSFDSTVVFTTGNTATPGAGASDLTLPGPAAATLAGLATTNVVDSQGNDIQGAAGRVVDVCKLISNQSGGALAVGDIIRGNGTTNQVTSAQADTLVNAEVIGVMVTAPASATLGYMSAGNTPVCNFDGVPTPGAIAYLSPGTARALTTTVPVIAGTNQKLRTGRVVNVVTGTLARVAWHPENLAVLANGAA